MAHKAGDFCWIELMTTDVAKVRPFYTALLGWKYKEVPMPGGMGGTYVMPQVDGIDAAGMSRMDPQQAKQMPPHWGLYVAVENVDATQKKATELGGKVLMPAFDIPDVGRMAVIQDPSGAVISLYWKDGKHSGFGTGSFAEKTGAFCWGELMTDNIDRAKTFYTKLFGWTTGGDPSYVEWMNGGRHIGGMMTIPKEAKGMPPAWVAYFTVPDTRKAIDIAKQNGGKMLDGPREMEGVGIFATIQDPAGAVFSLYQSGRKK